MSTVRAGRPIRVVLLGRGAINGQVAALLHSRVTGVKIVGVAVRDKSARRTDRSADAKVVDDPAELAALEPDVVLEAASKDAVSEWGEAALRAARRVVISSASAFVDDQVLRSMQAVARQCGSQLVLSPGAVAGIEALAAGARKGLHEVRHRIIKPPSGWPASIMQQSSPVEHESVIFRGSAREAAREYPLNANVAVVVGLASIGLDRTVLEMVVDPDAVMNRHEVFATGDFGSLKVEVVNRPLERNPRSSLLAALALVRLAENEVAEVVL